MPDYSHTQLGTFETCPLQYRIVYVDRLKRYIEGVEAFLGKRFHEAMEMLYGGLAFPVPSLEDLLAYYESQWAAKWSANVKIVKEGRTEDDYRRLGRRFIEDYYRRHRPFEEGRVVGLERTIKFPLDASGRYGFKGVIDRLMIAPDRAFEIHDYKTGSELPTQPDVDRDRQLALYQIGVQKLWPEARDVRLVWHYVAFDVEMRSTRTPEALAEVTARTMAIIHRIEAETAFEPHESPLCSWCPYWDLCPAKKHLLRLEDLPRERWKNEPGVAIVDAYAEAWARKQEVDASKTAVDEELDALRDAAIAFAEREGVNVIGGTDRRLRVTGRDRTVSPAKGSEEREALEGELRALGVWDDVVALDTFALDRAIAEGRWDAATIDRIKAYIRTEKRWTVTLQS
jgi:putative RecB family exonuclease